MPHRVAWWTAKHVAKGDVFSVGNGDVGIVQRVRGDLAIVRYNDDDRLHAVPVKRQTIADRWNGVED